MVEQNQRKNTMTGLNLDENNFELPLSNFGGTDLIQPEQQFDNIRESVFGFLPQRERDQSIASNLLRETNIR